MTKPESHRVDVRVTTIHPELHNALTNTDKYKRGRRLIHLATLGLAFENGGAVLSSLQPSKVNSAVPQDNISYPDSAKVNLDMLFADPGFD